MDPNKRDGCLFNLQKSQFVRNEEVPQRNITINVECEQALHAEIQSAVSRQIKFEALKNPAKYKETQLSLISVQTTLDKSESTKIERFFSGIHMDTKEQNTISLYIHPHYFQLLTISLWFKQYLLGQWIQRVKTQLVEPNSLQLKGEFSLGQISQVKTQIVACIIQTLVIKYSLKKIHNFLQLIGKYPQLNSCKQFSHIPTDSVYFYTKDPTVVQNTLKVLTNLWQKEIRIRDIFQDGNKLIVFLKFYLPQCIEQAPNLAIVVGQQQQAILVRGQITHILEFQKGLHLRYIDLNIMQIEFQLTRVKTRITNKHIRLIKASKVVFLTHMISQKQGLKVLSLKIASYNNSKLQEMSYSLLNQLSRIQFEVIHIESRVSTRQKAEIMHQFNVDVVTQKDLVIVSGLPTDIQEFKKKYKFKPRKVQRVQPKRSLTMHIQKRREQKEVKYQLVMPKTTSAKFQALVASEVKVYIQELQHVSVVTVYVHVPTEEKADIKKLQSRILEFCLSECALSSSISFHSSKHFGVQELQISDGTVDILKRWGVDHKAVQVLSQVHNLEYEYKYTRARGQDQQVCVSMLSPLPIHDVQDIVLRDIRELGICESLKIFYLFRTKFEVSANMNTTLVLGTAHSLPIQPGDSHPLKLRKYQFMVKYVVKLNGMAIKILSEHPP